MTSPVVHVQFGSDDAAYAFGDYANKQEGVLGVTLSHLDAPEPGQPRFYTGPIEVTGHTPGELESEAIAHTAMATGWPLDRLAVRTPYRIRTIADLDGLPDAQLSREERHARASGHPLYAGISISGYGPGSSPSASQKDGQAKPS